MQNQSESGEVAFGSRGDADLGDARSTHLGEEGKGDTSRHDAIEVLLDAISSGKGDVCEEIRMSSDRVRIGDKVADFTILRRLGGGGMGEVFEAQQDVPRRTVALKVLHPECLSEAGIKRLRAEATLLDRARHPGIVTVYGAGTVIGPAGLPMAYLAMELVEGGLPITVAARRLDGDLTAIVRLFLQLCEAVAHAHRNGVVHLDIKPTNALVGRDGAVKLIDFGLARAAEGVVPRTDCPSGSTGWIGTYEYMAPEQFTHRTEQCGARADVYSLGVLMYELLTARRPLNISGLSPFEIGQLLNSAVPAPASTVCRDIPDDVCAVAAKCLEPLADMRYCDAIELCDDMIRLSRGASPVARQSLSGRTRRWVRLHSRALLLILSLGLGVSLAILGASAWKQSRSDLSTAEDRLTASLMRDASAALARGSLALASMYSSGTPLRYWENTAIEAIASRPLFEASLGVPIKAAEFGPNDQTITVALPEGRIRQLCLQPGLEPPDPISTGFELHRMTRLKGAIGRYCFCRSDGVIELRNCADLSTVTLVSGIDLAMSPDSLRCATLYTDSLEVTSIALPPYAVCTIPLQGRNNGPIAWLSNSTLALATDGCLRTFDVERGTEILDEGKTPPSTDAVVMACLIASPAGLLRISRDRGLELLSDSKWQQFPDASYGPAVTSASVSSEGDRIALGLANGAFVIFDFGTGRYQCNTSAHCAATTSICWSSNDEFIATSSADGRVCIWPSSQDRLCPRSDSRLNLGLEIASFAASTTGDTLALFTSDGDLYHARLRPEFAKTVVCRVPGLHGPVAISIDGNMVAWATPESLMRADAPNFEVVEIAQTSDLVIAMASLHDSLIVLDAGGVLCRLDTRTGSEVWVAPPIQLDPKEARIVRSDEAIIVVQTSDPDISAIAFDARSGRIVSKAALPRSLAHTKPALNYSHSRNTWYWIDNGGIARALPEISPVQDPLRSNITRADAGFLIVPDESRLIATSALGHPTVLSPDTLELRAWMEAPPIAAKWAVLSPETQVLTIAASSGEIRQYNAPSPFRQAPYYWEPHFDEGKLGFRRIPPPKR
ncbi:MAG: protein kinase [Phycisphaerae bacterium]|nr:protein kinase [Phycisphaerae bacterium]